MTALDLNKQIKNELKGRTVDKFELLQYEIIAKENKLDSECILKAVQFAKLIKGSSVSKGYIIAIIKDWAERGLNTTAKINAMLMQKNYHKINNAKYVKVRTYSKAQINALFDNIASVEL